MYSAALGVGLRRFACNPIDVTGRVWRADIWHANAGRAHEGLIKNEPEPILLCVILW